MSVHTNCFHNQNKYQIRQRYNPTFVHAPIFDQQTAQSHLSRCTPTYHSTVLQNDGYNIKTIHHKGQAPSLRPNTALQRSVYINNTHQKRVQDLNPQYHAFGSTKDKWYDHTKQQMLQTIKQCRNHGYSKQRKYVDLSSDPVFTDYVYGVKGNLLSNSAVFHPCDHENREVSFGKQNIKHQDKVNEVQKIISFKKNDVQGLKNPFKKAQLFLEDGQGQKTYQQRKGNQGPSQASTKKNFHKNCIPQIQQNLKLKGKRIDQRPLSQNKSRIAQKSRIVAQKPTFTVIRKNRIPHY